MEHLSGHIRAVRESLQAKTSSLSQMAPYAVLQTAPSIHKNVEQSMMALYVWSMLLALVIAVRVR
jgi:hypothetical protein